MSESLSTQTAFITGAASGIGRATANALYQRGWTLGLADLNTDGLQELTEHWDDERAFCYELDVTDCDACTRCLDAFAQQTGGALKVLFNSAGILYIDRFENVTPKQHQLLFDINVMGLIHCTQAAHPYLKQAPNARVINMSSSAALYGVPHVAGYSASKFAVRGLTEALNIEWIDDDIRVCDVMPPLVNTSMLDGRELPPVMQRLGNKLLPEDVVDQVLKHIDNPWVHRPVGTKFSILALLNDLGTNFLTGWVMRLMHRL